MPDWDATAVAATARRLRLDLDARRRRLGLGTRLGAGAGSSLEFHDHRPYAPGDDPRHLDWGVYARSDQLVIRRHRQEVSPRLELLLDLSASMAAHPAKLALATALAALLATLARADGARPSLWLAGGSWRKADGDWQAALRAAGAAGAAGLEALPGPSLAAGADRVLISDGLCPGGAGPLLRRLGAAAGRICLVQVLARSELDPPEMGAVRLEDVEGGAEDLILDRDTCDAYRSRLARHQAGWSEALAGRGAGLVTVCADDGLPEAVRHLLSSGVVAVAGGRR